MPRLSFGAAMAASFQGQKLLQDLEYEKAQTDDVKAQAQQRKMEVMVQQQKAEGMKQVQSWMQANAAEEAQPGTSAETNAKRYMQGAQTMLQQGNFDGYKIMTDLSKTEVERAKQLRVEQEAETAQKKEGLARDAIDYVANPSPEGAIKLAKSAAAAGVNPVTIPDAKSMEFTAWAKNQRTASLTAKDNLSFLEKQQEYDRSQTEREEARKQRDQDRAEQRSMTAQFQQNSLEMRREGLELRRQLAESAREDKKARAETSATNAQFKQAEVLNAKTQREAKPMLTDLGNVEKVKALLRTNSSISDQQINQVLPSLIGELKGRATNVYYKDNRNFGNVAEKLEGMLSRGLSGRYSEEQRKQIYNMVDQLQKQVLEPGLDKLEKDQKRHATKYGIDPDLIEVQGKPDREEAPPKPAAGAPKTMSWGDLPK